MANMEKNMTLRTKLVLGFGLIVLLLLQNGVFTFFQLSQLDVMLSKASSEPASAAVQRHLDQFKMVILMMTALGLLLAIMVTVFMARSIFAPLARICTALADAVDGMGDHPEKQHLVDLAAELRRLIGSRRE
jgi:hypothetical protein